MSVFKTIPLEADVLKFQKFLSTREQAQLLAEAQMSSFQAGFESSKNIAQFPCVL